MILKSYEIIDECLGIDRFISIEKFNPFLLNYVNSIPTCSSYCFSSLYDYKYNQ